jgi:ribosomal protein S18 acetylase RimI-like enzyme
LGRQLYSRDTLLGLEQDLETKVVLLSSRFTYSLQPASEKDIEELLTKAKTESKASAHELIERKWFYESGFCDCYVARTTDAGELCFIAWLVSPKDSSVMSQGFRSRLPSLKEDELLLENCYTFERYRGNGIMPSVVGRLCELARSQGFKRLITYVRQDNRASLRAFDKLGLRKFEEIPELKLLFFTRRKHN